VRFIRHSGIYGTYIEFKHAKRVSISRRENTKFQFQRRGTIASAVTAHGDIDFIQAKAAAHWREPLRSWGQNLMEEEFWRREQIETIAKPSEFSRMTTATLKDLSFGLKKTYFSQPRWHYWKATMERWRFGLALDYANAASKKFRDLWSIDKAKKNFTDLSSMRQCGRDQRRHYHVGRLLEKRPKSSM